MSKFKKHGKERGSITLFVLLAILFFIIIAYAIYANTANSVAGQNREIKAIQEHYEQSSSEEQMDKEYDDLVNENIHIALYFASSGEVYSVNQWTNQNLKVEINFPTSVPEEERYYTIDGIRKKYEGEFIIEKNCTILSEYKDMSTKVDITRIDKEKPKATFNPDGGNISIAKDEKGIIEVVVTATDAGGSGVNTLQYAWSTSNTTEPTEQEWVTFENGGTARKTDCTEGSYYLWTKVTDVAGNETIEPSKEFKVKTNKKDLITLTPNPSDWTNQDVTVTIDYDDTITGDKTITVSGTEGEDYEIIGETEVVIKTNDQTITVTVTDETGEEITKEITISNIDKIKPVVTLAPNGSSIAMPDSGNATIKTTLTAKDKGGSGLNRLQYAWSTSKDEEPKEEEWKPFENGETVSKEDCKAGTYYLWTRVTDIAGNRAEEVKVSNSFEVTKLESPMTVTNKTVKVQEQVDLSTLVNNAKGNVTYKIKSQTTQGSKIEGNTLIVGTNPINEDADKTVVIIVTDAGNENYNTISKEITITVQKYIRTLEWEETTPDEIQFADTSKKATVKVSGEGGTAGEITYHSSNQNYLTVEANTGVLTPIAVGGSSEITAVMAGTGTVKSVRITKTIYVQKSSTATAVAQADKIYNGVSQIGVSGNHVTWTGITEATDVGTYIAIATPEENYAFEDGSTDAKTITWKINAKEVAVIWEDVTSFVYNGKPQAPSATAESGVDGEILNIVRTTGINVGTYTSTARLESVTGGSGKISNYILTNTTKQFTITNEKIVGSVTITGTNQYGSTLIAETIVSPEDATLTYQWYSNTDNSTSGGTPIDGATKKEYTVGDGLVGKYIYVVVTAEKENYDKISFTDITDDETNGSKTVTKVTLQKPTINGTYTYNGKNQTLNINNYDANQMNVSGNTGTDAGDYTATITLKDGNNYQWEDGTVTNIVLNWKINAKEVAVIWGEQTSFAYDGKEHAPTVVAESGVEGETLNITRTTATEIGIHTSTATLESVTGGRGKTTNYVLTGTSKEFVIADRTIQGNVKITGTNQYGSTLTAETLVSPEDATLTYQWYSNTNNSTSGGTPIDGATNKEYIVGEGLIGKYIYVVVTAKKTDYEDATFTDITDPTNNESATVMKATLEKPIITETYTYNGEEQTANVEHFDTNSMNISGNIEIDAGDYVVTISLKDSTNYQWSDGSVTDIELDWKINTKKIETVWGITTTFVYNGKEQAPTVKASSGVNGEVINVVRTTAINVGTYTSVASIESVTGGRGKTTNYTLINNTKQFTITNEKIVGSVKITGTNQYGSTLTAETEVNPEDATLTYQWYSHTENSTEGGIPIEGATEREYTVGDGLIGKYIYVVVTAEKENYGKISFADITDDETNGSKTVTKISLQKPTVNGTYTYNGKDQTLSVNNYDVNQMNISGNIAADAGDYTATVTLKDKNNYQWSDGTVTNIVLNWKINAKEVAVIWGNEISFSYDGKEHAPTVVAESGVEGETLNITRTTATEIGKHTSTATLESVTGGRGKTTNYVLTGVTKEFTIADMTIKGNVTIIGTNQYGSTLTAETEVNPGDATLTYQWYSNTNNSTSGGTPIDGATQKEYVVGDGLVGKYIYVVVTAKKPNYGDATFSDITDGSNNGSETVMKITVAKPTATGNYIYNATTQTVTLTGYDSATMNVTGNTGIDAGDYVVTISLKDSSNYQWSGGIIEDVTYNWKISPKEVKVVWGEQTSFIYNGKEQAPSANADSGIAGETLNVTRTTAITIGDYTSTAKLESVTGGRGNVNNYVLTNTTIEFHITNASIAGSVTIVGKNEYGSTLTAQTQVTPQDATLTYQWYSNTNNSTNGGTPIDGAIGKEYTVGKGLIGKYIYVIVTAEKENYGKISFSDITDDETNGSKTVTKLNLAKPTVSGTYTYNGATQTVAINGYDAQNMTISGNTGIDAGDYLAEISLNDTENIQWLDGTIEKITFQWKINAKSVAVVWGENTSFIYNGEQQAPTATAESGVTGETINLTRTTGINVGTYTSVASMVSVTGGRGRTDNYILTNTTKEFTITNQKITGSVTITGNNQYGSVLTAKTEVNPGDATLTYQWYSNTSNSTSGGTPIKDATGSTYQIGDGLIGKYIYVVVTAKKTNYADGIFTDITDVSANGSGTVIKVTLNKPTAQGEYTYNGATQTLEISGYDAQNMTISGNTGIDAGDYAATIKLKDSNNYQWSDGSITDVILTWKINAKSVEALWGTTISFVYNGKAQAPTVKASSGINGEVLNVTRTTAIEVGDYTSQAKIESVTGGRQNVSNYILTNNTKEFHITNAKITGSVTITGKNQYGSTLTAQTQVNPEDAELTYQWYSNTSNSTSGGTPIDGATGKDYTIEKGLVGKYIYVVVTAKKPNYGDVTFNDITDSTNNESATVMKADLEKPTVSGTYTYNGKNQKITLNSYDENVMSVTGDTGTDAGDYTATVTLKDSSNYQWLDGTTSNVTLNWKINPKQVPVIWGETTSFVYNGKAQAPTATAESGVEGETLNITRTTAINVGDYTSTATLESVTGGRGKVSNYTLIGTTKEFSIANVTITGSVTIKGTNQYGSTLTAETVINPEDADLTYQWYVSDNNATSGGTPIDGANQKNYIVGSGLAGKYIYVVVTAKKPNYGNASFTDITDPTNNGSATVMKISLDKPTVSGTYTYNGTTQTLTINGIDTGKMNVSGNTGIDAGNYTATVTLKDSSNYQWSDGTIENITFNWVIQPKTIAVTWGTTTSFVYNGSAQAPSASASSGISGETLNITRTTGVNVGSYTSTASLSSVTGGQGKTSNYTLTNTTKAFTITNATITGSVKITGTNQYGSTLTAQTTVNPGDATLSYQWYSNTSNSTSGGTVISGATGKTYQIGSGLVGKYIYVVVTAKKTNYTNATFSDITDSTNNGSATVTKIGLNKPTVSGTYTYNGTTQTLTINGIDTGKMNVSGNTGIDAGNYTATVTLKDSNNYQWSDGTVGAITFSWKINPKTVAVTWGTTTSFVYNGSAQAPSASASSGVSGETLNITRTTGVNVGNYTSTASITSVTGGRGKASNYTLTNAMKAFTITNATITGSVKITGTNQYGSTLTAQTTVNPGDATLSYQWYSNTSNSTSGGTAISGATGRTYKVGSGLVGKYIYVVVTAKKTNYANATFRDITDSSNNGSATVTKISLNKPTASGTYTYNGNTQTLSVSGYNSSTMNISGNTGINAGSYTATVTLKDSSNYQWSDGTTSGVSLGWKINPKSVAVTWGTTTSFVYNGSAQAPSASASSGVSGETLNITRTTGVNVGSYTSTASLSSVTGGQGKTSNYTLTNTTKAFTITNATITGSVKITGTNQYGSTLTAQTTVNPGDATLSYQWYSNTSNSTSGGTAISGATGRTYKVGSGLVGKYIYVVVTAKKTNYANATFRDITDSSNNGSATVTKISVAKPTVSGTYTYNGNTQTLSVSGYNSSTMNISGNTGINAGSYTATVTLKDSSNYQWSDGTTSGVSLGWKINPKAVAVTWGTTTSFVYNGSAQAPSASASSGVSGETLNITRTTGVNVGSYTSTASLSSVTGGQGKTSNYTLTNTTKAFTITNATITGSVKITGTNQYGSTLTAQTTVNPGDATLSYQWYSNTSNSTSGGTAISGATGRTYKVGSGLVGKYIYVVVTAKKTNYANATFRDITDSSNNGSATVTKISVAKPTASGTYTYNGNTQTLSVSGYNSSTMNISGNTGKNAGSYTATVTLKDSSNYQWSDGTTSGVSLGWKINPKQISVTWGSTTSFTYNGSAQAPTASASSGVSGETLNITRTTQVNAGSYTSTASLSSVTGGQGKTSNYTLTNTTKAFTITRAKTATASSTNKTYNGATQTGVTGSQVTWSGTQSAIDAGTYTAKATPTSNYAWSDGTTGAKTITWTMNKKSVAVTWGSTTFTYNGKAQGPTASATSGVSGETIKVTRTTETNVGTYTSTASISSVSGGRGKASNYTLTGNTKQFTIARAKTATASSTNKTYNGASQTGVSGSNVRWSGTTSAIDAGTYSATATPTSNYAWSDGTTGARSVSWTINKKSVSVTWGSTTSFTYNGSAQAPTASASSGVSGETLNITRTTQVNAGSYTSTASLSSVTGGRAKTSNYTLTNTTKAYTINKKSSRVSSSSYSGNYDGSSHTITLTVSEPTSGYTIYYSTSTSLNSSNYTSGTTTKPTRSAYGTTTVYWYVRITNGNYTDASGSNTITIKDATAPTVTYNPNGGSSFTVASNGYATIKTTITVTDSGGSGLNTGSLQYAWSTSATSAPSSGWRSFSSGQTVSKTDCGVGNYYVWVRASDNAGNTTTKASSAFVISSPTVKITTNPTAKTVVVNNNATFTVAATGTGVLSYQWYYNTSNSTSGGTLISGATGTSYTVKGTTGVDKRYYYCVVTSKIGTTTAKATSSTALLRVLTVSITKQPANQTVVNGNTFTFTVTGSGSSGATISYQWYYSANSSSASNWQAASKSSTYSGTADSGLNGRYIYCKVTATLNGVSTSVNSNTVRLTTQTANYSTLKSGKTTYYYTLQNAINGATSGGGDTGGGTIKVLNTQTDNSAASTNKTIAIDTNGKTLTRNGRISSSAGTVTIKGNGTVYCNVDGAVLDAIGGNVATSGSPVLRCNGTVVSLNENSKGTININGGYIWSSGRSSVSSETNSTGTVTIKNAWVYTDCRDKAALEIVGKGTVNIDGSKIGNAGNNRNGIGGAGVAGGTTISMDGPATLNVNNSVIYAGIYGGAGITRRQKGTVNITGSTSIFANNNTSPGYNAVLLAASGCSITINTTGYIRATGSYAVSSGSNSATYSWKKGQFACKGQNMFYIAGRAGGKYTGRASQLKFQYMNAYNKVVDNTITKGPFYTRTY